MTSEHGDETSPDGLSLAGYSLSCNVTQGWNCTHSSVQMPWGNVAAFPTQDPEKCPGSGVAKKINGAPPKSIRIYSPKPVKQPRNTGYCWHWRWITFPDRLTPPVGASILDM